MYCPAAHFLVAALRVSALLPAHVLHCNTPSSFCSAAENTSANWVSTALVRLVCWLRSYLFAFCT